MVARGGLTPGCLMVNRGSSRFYECKLSISVNDSNNLLLTLVHMLAVHDGVHLVSDAGTELGGSLVDEVTCWP